MGPYIILKRTWCSMFMRWNTHLYYAFVTTKFMIMCVHEFPLTHFHSTFELSSPYKDLTKKKSFLFIWIPHWIISDVQICKKGCCFVQKFIVPCLLHSHNYSKVAPSISFCTSMISFSPNKCSNPCALCVQQIFNPKKFICLDHLNTHYKCQF